MPPKVAGGKGRGVGGEQHFVALRRVGLHDEGATGAELQVRRQYPAPDPANDQMFFAPVELEGFPQFEVQRDIGFADRCAAVGPPAPDEFGDPAVVAGESPCLQFAEEFQGAAPIPFRAVRISLQGLDELRRIGRNLGVRVHSPVFRLGAFRRLEPAFDGIPAVARLPRDLRQ